MNNGTQRKAMKKAMCWEMTCTRGGLDGLRVIVAEKYVLTQTLEASNKRPQWAVEETANPAEAAGRALATTTFVENEYGGTLVVEPSEVVVHDSELAALSVGGKIPSALRARCFTTLQRKRATA